MADPKVKNTAFVTKRQISEGELSHSSSSDDAINQVPKFFP